MVTKRIVPQACGRAPLGSTWQQGTRRKVLSTAGSSGQQSRGAVSGAMCCLPGKLSPSETRFSSHLHFCSFSFTEKQLPQRGSVRRGERVQRFQGSRWWGGSIPSSLSMAVPSWAGTRRIQKQQPGASAVARRAMQVLLSTWDFVLGLGRDFHLHRVWLQASKPFIQPNCCGIHLSYIFYRLCSDAC